MSRKLLAKGAGLVGLLLAVSTTGAYENAWWTVDGGGGAFSSGGGFELSGTVGQPDASVVPMTGGGYELTGGFWPADFPAIGDMNCDGVIDVFDINPFVDAVLDPAAYMAAYPNCQLSNGDVNQDGVVDVFDINPFVDLLLAQ